MPEMPIEWWVRWAEGLMTRVYPVLHEVMKEEYLDDWLQGLYDVLIEKGVDPEEAGAIVFERE